MCIAAQAHWHISVFTNIHTHIHIFTYIVGTHTFWIALLIQQPCMHILCMRRFYLSDYNKPKTSFSIPKFRVCLIFVCLSRSNILLLRPSLRCDFSSFRSNILKQKYHVVAKMYVLLLPATEKNKQP